jgi:hypothetical protein
VGVRKLAPPLATLLEGDAGLALGAQVPGAGRSLLGRSFSSPELWTVRHSAPETAYRSVELASVSSVAATVGVNEHGLAAMVKALPSGSAALAGCAAPAALLVQDVLQRFDTVDKAAEWALRRPAGGAASLLLADATGALGGVYIEGRERRSLEPEDGLLFGLGAPAERAALEKVAAGTQQLDAEGLARSLIEAAGDGGCVAVADPAGRRLGIAQRGDVAWHLVERG